MIAILVLLTLTSIALSVATFRRLTSVQSKVASQLENLNQDKTSKLNLTQLTEIQNNISQTLIQLDDQVHDCTCISTELNSQNLPQCGAGLWWQVAYLDMTEPLQQCPSA